MGTTRRPFLVTGGEEILRGHKIINGKFPVNISRLRVSVAKPKQFQYHLDTKAGLIEVNATIAREAIARLGAAGAYTHDLGRYWAIRTLKNEPRLLRFLSARYPFILIDEAQDVGSMHGALLTRLQQAGTKIIAIGDPNQAIFEFADADGTWLREFGAGRETTFFPLSVNHRSVQSIVLVSNAISGASSTHFRDNPLRRHGAFILQYSKPELVGLPKYFETILAQNEYDPNNARVVCRGRALVETLSGVSKENGTGATRHLVAAALYRDCHASISDAFDSLLTGVSELVIGESPDFKAEINGRLPSASGRGVRQVLWEFLQDPNIGLPSAFDDSFAWHSALKIRMDLLLDRIMMIRGSRRKATWNNNLTKARLPAGPLASIAPAAQRSKVSVQTVHQVKGQSIEAVMFVMRSEDVGSLLRGVGYEEGRIGYVAVTRAQDLLILAVPGSCKKKSLKALSALGLDIWAD
jgi:hypothetical protein